MNGFAKLHEIICWTVEKFQKNASKGLNGFAIFHEGIYWIEDMKFHTTCIISTFLSLMSSSSSNVEVTDDHSNQGLINSAIVNNWSQSLNIGSVSLCDCLLLMLVGLVLFLRLNDRMSQTETPTFLHGSKITFRCKCTRKVQECVCNDFVIQVSFKNEVRRQRVVKEI